MPEQILVAGIGNIFLSDDGFGAEVARRMVAGAHRSSALPEGVRVVDYGIRGMHLAYDLLDGVDALILVDALPGAGPPGEITVLEIGPDDLGKGDFDAHGMDPVAVLASLGSLGGTLPPTYIVGCRPGDVSEGIGLSPAVESAVDEAIESVRWVLEQRLSVAAGAGRDG